MEKRARNQIRALPTVTIACKRMDILWLVSSRPVTYSHFITPHRVPLAKAVSFSPISFLTKQVIENVKLCIAWLTKLFDYDLLSLHATSQVNPRR
jgi:hypothetical protein